MPSSRARVLIIDDDEDDYVIVRDLLRESRARDYVLDWAPTFEAALEALDRRAHDVYLVDYRLGARSGLDLVREARARGIDRPFVMLTGTGSPEVDIAATDAGVDDYLVKGRLSGADLERVLRYALARARVRELQGHADALRESEARLRELADALPQIVWTATPDGQRDYVNARWTAFTGLPPEQGLGAAWQQVLHPEDAHVIERWSDALRTRAVFDAEGRLRDSRGAWRWHLHRAVAVPGRDGAVLKWFGTSTDIDDQKEALRARDEFLAAAAHELKTPLNALQLSCDSLRTLLGEHPDRRVLERLNTSARQVARLGALVHRLLDVSRIVTARLELELETADLADIVREAVEREVGSRIPVTLRASPAPGRWDRLRADQIVTNLLSNALKYGEGSPIEVDVGSTAGEAVIRVKDHGPGVAPEDRERIFRRFERATTLRHVGGLGLGLWIVSEIVKAMGGTVALEGQVGQGATFTVRLPSSAAAQPQ